jgi:uncharacterized protein
VVRLALVSTMNQNAVEIEHLGTETVSLEGAFAPGQIDFSTEDVVQRDPITWAATLERKGGGIRFAGKMRTRIELPCVRCLEPIVQVVDRPMDLFFELGESGLFEDNEEVELDEADTDTAFIVGNELHIDEIMREQVVLDVPMKPLCRVECKGLCSTCGANLNERECDCQTAVTHPAFEKLADFKKQLEDRGNSATD